MSSATEADVRDSIFCTVTTKNDDAAATSTPSVVVDKINLVRSGSTISGGTYNTDTLTFSATVIQQGCTIVMLLRL